MLLLKILLDAWEETGEPCDTSASIFTRKKGGESGILDEGVVLRIRETELQIPRRSSDFPMAKLLEESQTCRRTFNILVAVVTFHDSE